MVVIIDSGVTVKQFGSEENARGYAEAMMQKRHSVWLVSNRTAKAAEYI